MNIKIYQFFRAMTFVGIGVLMAIAALSLISIVGRSLNGLGLSPVPGDFELVEVGTAVAVFCFLPWTHLRRAHAVVDLFWGALPKALKPFIVVMSDLLMLLLWVVLIWRMGVAIAEYRDNGETTLLLLMPMWLLYSAAMVPAALGLFAYLWKLLESLGLVRVPDEYAVTMEGAH